MWHRIVACGVYICDNNINIFLKLEDTINSSIVRFSSANSRFEFIYAKPPLHDAALDVARAVMASNYKIRFKINFSKYDI